MFEATKIISENNDWITIVFVVILLMLTLVKILFSDRLYNTSTLFLSKKYLSIYFNKENNQYSKIFNSVLYFVQVLTLSLVLYLSVIYFQLQFKIKGFNLYVLLLLGVSFYFFARYLIGLILAFIFNLKNERKRIIFEKRNYFSNLVLWLLPFLVLTVFIHKYEKLLFEITFTLFVLLIIIRYGLLLLNNKKLILNNLFYFILYICALEIAPLIIILKLTI